MRRRRMFMALGVVLVAALIADMTRIVKPSGLSAAACVPVLFRKAADESQFLDAARNAIIRESERSDLPSLLVAAIVLDHRRQMTPYRAFTDCFGSALGKDLSLGPAQVRMSTAAQLDGQSFSTLTAPAHRRLRALLLDTTSNTSYAAMALLVTEYRSGRMPTEEENSPVGANASRTLRLMQDDALEPFRAPDYDVASARAEIEAYFAEIQCRKGKSNRACARRSPG